MSINLKGQIDDVLKGTVDLLTSGSSAVIESKSIFANGIYEVPSGVDGFNPVIVDVPAKIEKTLSVTENGTYTPEEGQVYNGVIVNVQQSQPVIQAKTITENGTYTAPSGVDGYSPITVNVPLPQNAYLLKSVANLPQAIASFNDGEEMVMPSLKVAIEPQQEGSGDPSPENVRPISGWDEVNIANMSDITNKAYFDGLLNGTYGVVDLGSLSWSYISSGDSMRTTIADAKSGTTNFVSILPYTASFVNTNLRIYETGYTDTDAFKQAMSGVHLIYELATPATPTITPTEFSNLLAEFGIDGHLYTIDLDGTRYGGEVDVVNGVLMVDKVCAVYDGSADENWFKYGSGSVSAFAMCSNNALLSNINAIPIASYLKGILRNETWGNYDNWVSVTSGDRLVTGMQSITEVEDWKTYLSSNNLQVVYELATPLTIQLTPTVIKSLRGVTNVYANTGDIKDAEYFSKV